MRNEMKSTVAKGVGGRKFKRLLTGFLFFLILSLISIYPQPKNAKADGNNENIDIRLEASKDNGATWHNYSGTNYSGGETVSANPGDTVLIKFTAWDGDAMMAANITISGTITNSSYLTVPESGINSDADGNHTSISGIVNTFGGGATISTLDALGSYSSCSPLVANCESATFSLVLSSTFPVGETIILGEAGITDFTDRAPVRNPFIDRAYASSVGHKSAFRIAVNVAAPTTVVTTNLPATGSPIPYSDITLGIIIGSGILYPIIRHLRHKKRV